MRQWKEASYPMLSSDDERLSDASPENVEPEDGEPEDENDQSNQSDPAEAPPAGEKVPDSEFPTDPQLQRAVEALDESKALSEPPESIQRPAAA